jgi:hypothetical protein
MSWKMLALLVAPAIGRAVSRGVLATKDLEVPKGAGLLWARKGARPVAVGPIFHEHRIPEDAATLRTGIQVGRCLEILGHS